MKVIVGGVAAGLTFGLLNTVADVAVSPYTGVNTRAAESSLVGAAKVASLLLSAGWCWAGLALVVGWLTQSLLQAALTAAAAVTSAMAARDVLDWYLLGTNTNPVAWLIVAVATGTVFGVIGVLIKRPGIAGLVAALIVPTGAALQIVIMLCGMDIVPASGSVTAGIVLVGAASSAVWALLRYKRQHRTASESSLLSVP